MQYRRDPKSGKSLSILGFGCMRLPGGLGRVDIPKSEKLLLDAVQKGINYFDTAYLYPGSEAAVGQIFEKHNLRKDVYIATKLPHSSCKSPEDFDKFFDKQLERLKTNYIDYYLIHNISSLDQWKRLKGIGILEWITEKKSQGQIHRIGFSYHGPLDDFLKLLEDYDWEFCQIQYNYININYQAGRTGLQRAAELGIPVFIMEPLLGGKLTNGLPKKAEELFRQADPDLTPAGWALRWLWNQPEVTLLLSGMNEPEQLNENTALADAMTPGSLTDRELEAIDQVIKIFNESYKIPCTGCNYCMPCPQKINIPACFSAYNSRYAIGWFTGTQQHVLSTGAMSKEPHYAGSCIKCGKCESHCPQNIPIRDSLSEVSRKMEPFWLRAAMSVTRKLS